MGQAEWFCSFSWAASPKGKTPILCPTVPAQQAVGPRAGIPRGRGPISLVLAPTLAHFPWTLPWARPLSRAAVLQPMAWPGASVPPTVGRRWKVTPSTWKGCLRLTGWNRSCDPTSRPTSWKEDCGLGPREQEDPPLPLRFLVDEQRRVSLLEARWAAAGGVGWGHGREGRVVS